MRRRWAQLAWLPLLAHLGIVAHLPLVLWRTRRGGLDADRARTACIRDCWLGRGLWTIALFWPALALWLHLPAWLLLAGTVAFMGLAQVALFASIAAFFTWTQALVPGAQRSRFHAIRSVLTQSTVLVAILLLAVLWPRDAEPRTTWFLWLFGAATACGIIGTLWLSWSPRAAASPPPMPTQPLAAALAAAPGLRRFVAFNALHVGAMALGFVFINQHLVQCGVTPDGMATVQVWLYLPLLIATAWCTGQWIRHRGTRAALIAGDLIWLAGDAVVLCASATTVAWLLPCHLALAALARGVMNVAWVSRAQEVGPPGDVRLMSLILAAGGAAGALAAGLALIGGDAIATWAAAHGTTAAWCLATAAVALRLASLALLPWRPAHPA